MYEGGRRIASAWSNGLRSQNEHVEVRKEPHQLVNTSTRPLTTLQLYPASLCTRPAIERLGKFEIVQSAQLGLG